MFVRTVLDPKEWNCVKFRNIGCLLNSTVDHAGKLANIATLTSDMLGASV